MTNSDHGKVSKLLGTNREEASTRAVVGNVTTYHVTLTGDDVNTMTKSENDKEQERSDQYVLALREAMNAMIIADLVNQEKRNHE